jgi:hypothetical protein
MLAGVMRSQAAQERIVRSGCVRKLRSTHPGGSPRDQSQRPTLLSAQRISVQPLLVGIEHGIGFGFRQLPSRLSGLGLLGEDQHSISRQVLEEPGVMNVQPRIRVALDPAMPGCPGPAASGRRFAFGHFRLYRETEGREAETGAGAQLRTGSIVKANLRGLAIVSRPGRGLVQERPYVGGAQAGDDLFVGNLVVGAGRKIAFRPRESHSW